MSKWLRVILITLFIILFLPADNFIYANPIDIINNILSKSDDNSKGIELINKILSKKDKQPVKIIDNKDEVKKEAAITKEKQQIKPSTANDKSYILGIDISKWNGDVDWKAVKDANIQFVIIRAGYGTGYVDPYFKSNIEAAIENNMIIGVYWFSYAYTYQQAKLEADKCYRTIKPYKNKIDLPIFWDFEYDSVNFANKHGHKINKNLASGMADTFCTTIKNKGFRAGIYTNVDYANNYFLEEVLNKYHTWIAQWTNSCTYKGNYIIWQCSDSYYINNKKFDLNRFYYNRYKNDIKQSKTTYKKMKVSATAYCGDSFTSTMTKPKWGVIAVDPRVIPYGSIVYIPEFDKYFVAEDCGGGIKGNRIDIFMNSESECDRWGKRTIEIKILQ